MSGAFLKPVSKTIPAYLRRRRIRRIFDLIPLYSGRPKTW